MVNCFIQGLWGQIDRPSFTILCYCLVEPLSIELIISVDDLWQLLELEISQLWALVPQERRVVVGLRHFVQLPFAWRLEVFKLAPLIWVLIFLLFRRIMLNREVLAWVVKHQSFWVPISSRRFFNDHRPFRPLHTLRPLIYRRWLLNTLRLNERLIRRHNVLHRFILLHEPNLIQALPSSLPLMHIIFRNIHIHNVINTLIPFLFLFQPSFRLRYGSHVFRWPQLVLFIQQRSPWRVLVFYRLLIGFRHLLSQL